MIGAGEKDRLIKIFPTVSDKDEAMAPVQVDGLAIDAWAKKEAVNFTTKYVNDQNQLITDVSFTVGWLETIVMPCRVYFEGQYFEVQHIIELGYHEDLKLVCRKARNQKAM